MSNFLGWFFQVLGGKKIKKKNFAPENMKKLLIIGPDPFFFCIGPAA